MHKCILIYYIKLKYIKHGVNNSSNSSYIVYIFYSRGNPVVCRLNKPSGVIPTQHCVILAQTSGCSLNKECVTLSSCKGRGWSDKVMDTDACGWDGRLNELKICCNVHKAPSCNSYLRAECEFEGNVVGSVKFSQCEDPPSEFVAVDGSLSGLTGVHHGFHIHQNGGPEILDDCTKAGPHFNALNTSHGSLVNTAESRHTGDLGNIIANEDGIAEFQISDRLISLVDGLENCILGRGVVIHAGEDDLGTGGDQGSLNTGNAGSRLGCCIINKSV